MVVLQQEISQDTETAKLKTAVNFTSRGNSYEEGRCSRETQDLC